MVTYHVLGHRGMLGSVVHRRWAELGGEPADVNTADYIVNCVFPDDWSLLQGLPLARVIQPSTDAIHEADPYALTKREVERIVKPLGLVIRTGLVDLRKQPVVAYTNWFVNPLTPLEWADLAWDHKGSRGLHEDGRETMSRFGVAEACHVIFDTPEPTAAIGPSTRFRVMHQQTVFQSLDEALRTFRDWLCS